MCKVSADQTRKREKLFFFPSMLYIGCIQDLRTRLLCPTYIDFENNEITTECTSIETRVGNLDRVSLF